MKPGIQFAKLRWQLAQTAERQWWKQYLKEKETYSYLAWKKEYWETLLEKTGININHYSGERVLDIGCGPAGIFICLEKFPVEAVDPLLDYYDTHLAQFSYDTYPYVQFASQPFETFKSDHKYKLIFCLNAINHFSNIKKSVQKIKSLIKKEGYLILCVDSHNYSLLKHLFRIFPGDILHPQQMDKKEYADLFMSNTGVGFELTKDIGLKKGTLFEHRLLVFKNSSL